MKILRKPRYLGARQQALEIQTYADTEGRYADKSRAARVAVGKSLIGTKVGLVRIAGKDHVARIDDALELAKGFRLSMTGTLTACDEDGVIAVE